MKIIYIFLIFIFSNCFANDINKINSNIQKEFNKYIKYASENNIKQAESYKTNFFNELQRYNKFYNNTKFNINDSDAKTYERAENFKGSNYNYDALNMYRKLIIYGTDNNIRQRAMFLGASFMMKMNYLEDAMNSLKFYKQKFPNGKYRADATARIRYCKNRLEKENRNITITPLKTKRRKKNFWDYVREPFQALERTIEYSLGTSLKYSVELTQKVYDSPKYNERIKRVTKRLLKVNERKRVHYQFKVLNQKYVNAFAVPGGFIYVTKALMDLVDSDDELAVVLGHEMGHIVAKHSIKRIKRSIMFEVILRLIKDKNVKKYKNALRLFNIMFYELPYSRANELEADRYGMRYSYLAGYDPYASVSFFKKLKKQSKNPEKTDVSKYFRTHPLTDQRIQQCYSYIPKLKKR